MRDLCGWTVQLRQGAPGTIRYERANLVGIQKRLSKSIASRDTPVSRSDELTSVFAGRHHQTRKRKSADYAEAYRDGSDACLTRKSSNRRFLRVKTILPHGSLDYRFLASEAIQSWSATSATLPTMTEEKKQETLT